MAQCRAQHVDVGRHRPALVGGLVRRVHVDHPRPGLPRRLQDPLQRRILRLAQHHRRRRPDVAVEKEVAARFDEADAFERFRDLHPDHQVGPLLRDVRADPVPPQPDLGFYEPASLGHSLVGVEGDREVLQHGGLSDQFGHREHPLPADANQEYVVIHHPLL